MKTKTYRDRLCAGLLALGWRVLPGRSRYTEFSHHADTRKYFVGKAGALRLGTCATKSHSVGDPAYQSPTYQKILAAGDAAPPPEVKPPGKQFFNFVRAPHAPLYERYSIEHSRHVKVGSPGTYGPIDPATGAEYKALGQTLNPTPSGKVSYSSDLKVGLFYSPTVFVWGYNDHPTKRGSEALPFEAVEAFVKKAYGAGVKRVLLPRGYERGGVWTWDNALMYCPPEGQPDLKFLAEFILPRTFSKCEIIDNRAPYTIEVEI